MNTDFIPLVPLASSGGRGTFSHTSQPRTRAGRRVQVVVVEEHHALADDLGRLEAEQALQDALGLLVAGMGLAGEHDLDGPVAGQQRQRPVGIADQQIQALVGGHPAGEADRQHLGIEGAGGGVDVAAQIAAAEPVGDAAGAHVLDELGALATTRLPQLRGRELPPPGPDLRVGGVVAPVLGQVAVKQLAHRRAQPGRARARRW